MMLRSIFAAFAAIFFALVETQSVSLSSLPQCAQGPATTGLASTTCDLTNIGCICGTVSFVTALTTEVKKACTMADQQATLAFAQSLCSKFGVTINVPGVAAAENVASTPATSAAQAVTAPTSTADADSGDSADDSADSARSGVAATSTDSTDMTTAPMATSTASYYANSTANTTVAASSPIPFVGGATSIKGRVQGPGLAMIFVVGIFCWL